MAGSCPTSNRPAPEWPHGRAALYRKLENKGNQYKVRKRRHRRRTLHFVQNVHSANNELNASVASRVLLEEHCIVDMETVADVDTSAPVRHCRRVQFGQGVSALPGKPCAPDYYRDAAIIEGTAFGDCNENIEWRCW